MIYQTLSILLQTQFSQPTAEFCPLESEFLTKLNKLKKSENFQWKKCRFITDIEKKLFDAAQYFHLKHLQN